MPGLTPLGEGTETLTALSESAPTPEVTEPPLFPSLATFPSLGTFPSSGSVTPATGLQLSGMTEGTETLTPLTED